MVRVLKAHDMIAIGNRSALGCVISIQITAKDGLLLSEDAEVGTGLPTGETAE